MNRERWITTFLWRKIPDQDAIGHILLILGAYFEIWQGMVYVDGCYAGVEGQPPETYSANDKEWRVFKRNQALNVYQPEFKIRFRFCQSRLEVSCRHFNYYFIVKKGRWVPMPSHKKWSPYRAAILENTKLFGALSKRHPEVKNLSHYGRSPLGTLYLEERHVMCHLQDLVRDFYYDSKTRVWFFNGETGTLRKPRVRHFFDPNKFFASLEKS